MNDGMMNSVSCTGLKVDKFNIDFCFQFQEPFLFDDIVQKENCIIETDNAILFKTINAFRYKYAFYLSGMNLDRVNRITDYKGVWSLVGEPNREGYASYYDLADRRIYWGIQEKEQLVFSSLSQLALCSMDKLDVSGVGSMLLGKDLTSINADGLLNIIKDTLKGLCAISFAIPSDDRSQYNLRVSLDVEGRNAIDHIYKDLANRDGTGMF